MYLIPIVSVVFLNIVQLVSNESKCGRPLGSNFTIQSERIVSGYDIGYYRYPWYAALMEKNQVACGGALISNKFVLTAAHCYKDYLMRNTGRKLEEIYTVRLGVYNICSTEKSVDQFSIEKVQVHELYLKKKPYFDICLLTLKENAAKFEPVCLPRNVISPRPKEGTVPGLGALKHEGPMPCTVQEARLLIYPDTACRKMINDSGNNPSDVVNAFCAGYLAGGIDTCQGDSGGPFEILDESGKYVLLGLVSFGFDCAMPGYLGMYTDVSRYISWIQNKTGLSDTQFLDSSHDSKQSDSGSEEHNQSETVLHTIHRYPHRREPLKIIIIRNKQRKHEAERKLKGTKGKINHN
ncbi:hypothetical protein ABEB36_004672 [Hypothenemus hampei]|uniref:Peptidase S1 domain-containing protein n=1 Tax=Hypothenemus hampei TaxID=57062 RepID=A0ABD1F431_HYPHA